VLQRFLCCTRLVLNSAQQTSSFTPAFQRPPDPWAGSLCPSPRAREVSTGGRVSSRAWLLSGRGVMRRPSNHNCCRDARISSGPSDRLWISILSDFLSSTLSGGVLQPTRRRDPRGARDRGAEIAPQPCIRSIREDRTMMQSCASVAKLRGSGPILHSGLGSHGFTVGSPPPRIHRQTPRRGCQTACPVGPLFSC
jgi:hypothetical protein